MSFKSNDNSSIKSLNNSAIRDSIESKNSLKISRLGRNSPDIGGIIKRGGTGLSLVSANSGEKSIK
jgi:hypothetical protein